MCSGCVRCARVECFVDYRMVRDFILFIDWYIRFMHASKKHFSVMIYCYLRSYGIYIDCWTVPRPAPQSCLFFRQPLSSPAFLGGSGGGATQQRRIEYSNARESQRSCSVFIFGLPPFAACGPRPRDHFPLTTGMFSADVRCSSSENSSYKTAAVVVVLVMCAPQGVFIVCVHPLVWVCTSMRVWNCFRCFTLDPAARLLLLVHTHDDTLLLIQYGTRPRQLFLVDSSGVSAKISQG